MIRMLQEMWLNWRKPFSVALVGLESGIKYPPMMFLRFKTYEDAACWILQRELSGHPSTRMTRFVIIDLRLAEHLDEMDHL